MSVIKQPGEEVHHGCLLADGLLGSYRNTVSLSTFEFDILLFVGHAAVICVTKCALQLRQNREFGGDP